MDWPLPALFAAALGLLALPRLLQRLQLSLAKHPSLRGHARWSRRIAGLLPYYALRDAHFFGCDGAPAATVQQRRRALTALAARIAGQSPQSLAVSAPLAERLPDVAFTNAYRVPFPFREELPAVLRQPSVLSASSGTRVCDLDGNWRQDLSGAYGVNVFGYDVYKHCIDEANSLARSLGPVLGPYHPVVLDNAERLAAIAGLDAVSFHMSGTEAVMQAVRLARYHTGRSHLVRFCGAYHGWWDGVQPGVGNERRVNDVYTLAEMSERSLRVIASRKDIACVLVNPLQALSPNADAPSDGSLLGSNRSAGFDRAAYTAWLGRLREACNRNGVVLILDEVLTGFRLARGGAQEYFSIEADLVTYGKTLGGGLPIGALAGRRELMQRFDPQRPARVSLARGTFNCHPYVMAAMNAFLRHIDEPRISALYAQSGALWDRRLQAVNAAMAQAQLPVRFAGLQSVWTTLYTQPCRFNWMYQFYLRAQGLELAWIGTGRLIFSLDYSDADFARVQEALVQGARQMHADGWWWGAGIVSRAAIRRQLIGELIRARFPRLALLLPEHTGGRPAAVHTEEAA
jgi:glutamate-1-semialdehyde 2,1-aminomutase